MATQRVDLEQWSREKEAIEWICAREGITPSQLAKLAGLDHHTVTDVIAGTRRLFLSAAQAICAATGSCLCLFDHREGEVCPEQEFERQRLCLRAITNPDVNVPKEQLMNASPTKRKRAKS